MVPTRRHDCRSCGAGKWISCERPGAPAGRWNLFVPASRGESMPVHASSASAAPGQLSPIGRSTPTLQLSRKRGKPGPGAGKGSRARGWNSISASSAVRWFSCVQKPSRTQFPCPPAVSRTRISRRRRNSIGRNGGTGGFGRRSCRMRVHQPPDPSRRKAPTRPKGSVQPAVCTVPCRPPDSV